MLAAMATQQIALMCLIYRPVKGREAKNIEATAHDWNPARGRSEGRVSTELINISPRHVRCILGGFLAPVGRRRGAYE